MNFRVWWLAWMSAMMGLSAGAALSTTAAAAERSWTISPAIASRYLFRGVERAGASFQTSFDYTADALSAGVWSNFALDDSGAANTDPEIDLYASYALSGQSAQFQIVPGFCLYTHPDAKRSHGGYPVTLEPNLATVFFVRGIQFTPKACYDLMLKGATFELTAAYALPLTTLGTELDFNASVGTFKYHAARADATPAVKNWGDYWLVGVSLPYQISARGRVLLNVTYSEGRNNYFKPTGSPRSANGNAASGAAVTLSYSVTL